jgi:penicillin-binding protein 1A
MKHKRLLLRSAAVVLGLGVLGLAVFSVWWTWFLCRGDACPSVAQFDEYQPVQPARLYAVDGRFIAEVGLERRSLVTHDQIPKHVIDAFVITEDKRYYDHRGIDYVRVVGAILANVRAMGFAEGFSTITMQLARNIFPEQLPSRSKASSALASLVRKFREAKVARQLEDRYSKERILELYLNQIALGAGAYGVESASQRYFGRSVKDITVAEGALLAALPKAPSRYNPRRFPDRAIQRRNTVLELMRRERALSDADASVAKAYPLRLHRPTRGAAEAAPYFVEWVRTELERRFGKQVYEKGLRVVTSLDLDMQGAAERALERQLRAIESGARSAVPAPHVRGVSRARRQRRTPIRGAPTRPTCRARSSRSIRAPARCAPSSAGGTSTTPSSTAPRARCVSRAPPSSRSSTPPPCTAAGRRATSSTTSPSRCRSSTARSGRRRTTI